ncbi:phage tail assembly chaperone, partial [Acinetobacter sp. G11]
MAILDFGIEPEVFWRMTEREFFTLVIHDLRRKEDDMLRMR